MVRKTFSIQYKQKLLNQQQNRCASCQHDIQEVSCSDIDHKIPLHMNGPNTMDNLQVLCLNCHRKKTLQEISQIRSVKAIDEMQKCLTFRKQFMETCSSSVSDTLDPTISHVRKCKDCPNPACQNPPRRLCVMCSTKQNYRMRKRRMDLKVNRMITNHVTE